MSLIVNTKVSILPQLHMLGWDQDMPLPRTQDNEHVLGLGADELGELVAKLVVLVQTPREYWDGEDRETFRLAQTYAQAKRTDQTSTR